MDKVTRQRSHKVKTGTRSRVLTVIVYGVLTMAIIWLGLLTPVEGNSMVEAIFPRVLLTFFFSSLGVIIWRLSRDSGRWR